MCKNTKQMSGSLLAFFHLCLVSALFSGPSLTKKKFPKKIFPFFWLFFKGFLNHLPNRRRMHLLCWRWTLLAWGKNVFCTSEEHFSAGDKCVENAHSCKLQPHTQLTISNLQIEPISRWLLLTGTHLRKQAVAIMLVYSHQSMLYPQVTCIYAIAFSAGLNGLLVD